MHDGKTMINILMHISKKRFAILVIAFVSLIVCTGKTTKLVSDGNSEMDGFSAEIQSTMIDNIRIDLPIIYRDNIQMAIIYDDVFAFFESYFPEFVPESTFHFQCDIYQKETIISIVYSGEVHTPARAIPQCFAFNYDIENGERLNLSQIADFNNVYTSLEDKNKGDHTLNLVYNFSNYRVVNGDINHFFDYFYREDNLYVVVSVSSGAGTYKVIEVEEKKAEDRGTVSVNSK